MGNSKRRSPNGPAPQIPVEALMSLRETLRMKPARELQRELHGLTESIAAESMNDDETGSLRFGISFTKNGTGFDYRIQRTNQPIGESGSSYETVKAPVDATHAYLEISYPADPHIDEHALRGAVLASIEEELQTRGENNSNEPTGLIDRISRLFDGLIYRKEE